MLPTDMGMRTACSFCVMASYVDFDHLFGFWFVDDGVARHVDEELDSCFGFFGLEDEAGVGDDQQTSFFIDGLVVWVFEIVLRRDRLHSVQQLLQLVDLSSFEAYVWHLAVLSQPQLVQPVQRSTLALHEVESFG